MILMKDIEGMELIVNKAGKFVSCSRSLKSKRINGSIFSSSIGIAVYDRDGGTYEELYEAADRALYNCKNCQKGTYAFCREGDGKISSR